MDKTIDKPDCPKCGSSTVYIKTSTKEIVCRRCGAITKLSEQPDGVK